MPKAKSAIKQARSSERKRLRNRAIKKRIRSSIQRFEQLVKENPQSAKEQGRQVVSLLDRAAKSQVLHVNAARRRKTTIMAQIQALPK